MPLATLFSKCPRGGATLRKALPSLIVIALSVGARFQAARQPPATPKVGAASVRWLCRDAACRNFPDGYISNPRNYGCDNCNMWDLLRDAFGVQIYRQFRGAPRWFTDDYYQVRLTAVPPASSPAQLKKSVLRGVLASCFSLDVRPVETPTAGFTLVVAPEGVKFQRVLKAVPPRDSDGVLHFENVAKLVLWLNQYYYASRIYGVTRPIADGTGLTGTFDIPVPFPKPGSGVNLMAVVRQLGFEVKSAPGTARWFDILRVDHLTASCTLP